MTENVPTFSGIAFSYRDALKIVLHDGKTGIRERGGKDVTEFKNVPRHVLVVATICNYLGKLCGLSKEELSVLTAAGILHDADKKIELNPESFTSQEISSFEERLRKFDKAFAISAVTKDNYLETSGAEVDRLTLSQRILYYADMIVSWDQIVTYDERVAELRGREDNRASDEHWRMEIPFGKEIEADIFRRLPSQIQEVIGHPAAIPEFLKEALN